MPNPETKKRTNLPKHTSTSTYMDMTPNTRSSKNYSNLGRDTSKHLNFDNSNPMNTKPQHKSCSKFPQMPVREKPETTEKHNCPTCQKEFATKKGKTLHRKQSATWNSTPNNHLKHLPILCPNGNCNELLASTEKLTNHLLYHCHPHNAMRELNLLFQNKNTHPDKMTNVGVPRHNISKKQGIAKYDTQNMKWECAICGKLEKPPLLC